MSRVDRHVAWIGLGSNVDDPAGHVRRALAELAADEELCVLACSALYRTAPVGGPVDQPMYCNAAAALATNRAPLALLERLQAIEAAHDRVRDIRWGPRTLDLDMLAFDALTMRHPRLTLPHPRAHERGFVLVPLAEIAPALGLDGGRRVIDWLASTDTADIERWDQSF